jgi:hypothetical protein
MEREQCETDFVSAISSYDTNKKRDRGESIDHGDLNEVTKAAWKYLALDSTRLSFNAVPQHADARSFAVRLHERATLENSIGFLNEVRPKGTPMIDDKNLLNPTSWALGMQVYMRVCLENPDLLDANPGYADQLMNAYDLV